MNSGWNWTLKLLVEKIKCDDVETKSHKEYDKRSLIALIITTKFGYVLDGRKKRVWNYRCKYLSNGGILGSSNRL
jgi:hypothetical protein